MDVPTRVARELLKITFFESEMQVGQEPDLAHL